jgi:hypothetical protein
MKLTDVIKDIGRRNPERAWYGLTDGAEWYDFRLVDSEAYQELQNQATAATAGNIWWEVLEEE